MNTWFRKLKPKSLSRQRKSSIIHKTASVFCGVSLIVGGLPFIDSSNTANASMVEKLTENTASPLLTQSTDPIFQVLSLPKTSENMSANSVKAENIVLHGAAKITTSKPRYITIAKIYPRTGKNSGQSLGSATANYIIWGTGRTSSGYTEIVFFGYKGWVKSNQLKRVAVANYITKKATKMYSAAAGGKVVSTIPTDYTVGSLTKSTNKVRVELKFKNKTGWVNLKDLKTTSINAYEGPGPKTFSNAAWSNEIKKNMSKYCKNTKVNVSYKKDQYFAESGKMSITMSRYGNHDPSSPMMKAISLHECAHILTYKLYPNFSQLVNYAEKINPQRDGRGIEHLADCMSDKMGAKRTGKAPNGGTYWSGYGGKCSSTQYKAASKLVSGKRI